MLEPRTESAVSVTVHPQEWMGSPGMTHHRGRRQLIPAGDRDPVIYTVPRIDAIDDVRALFPDESYEANLPQSHPVASSWVTNWAGPYHIRMTGGAQVMMKLIDHIDDYDRSVRYRSMTPVQRGGQS